MNIDFEKIDAARQVRGFLPISRMMALLDGNLVLDPFSTLISAGVSFGKDNVLYPGVTLLASKETTISLGNANILHSGTLVSASHGCVTIGDHNQFGEGGFTAKANRNGAEIRIGSHGRYLNNPSVFGQTVLGDGTQILGSIAVDTCTLRDGGSHAEPDPDLRGGLLKGQGTARNLLVPMGHVIAAQGSFLEEDILPQRHFHPKKEQNRD
ncbi:AraC family transcriptional regulator [Roseibium sp. SCP14]|uniref:AraC family transcriptional regulator n=1 Tax=Roseibium sp. SCP14 TaxID=3141375 RepID=UPI0033366CED